MFSAPVDDATLALLKEQGIKCPILVQGLDYEVLGWPGRLLPVFCIFILALGGVLLLRKPGKFNPEKMDAQQTRKMQQTERLANKVFGTAVALVLVAAVIPLSLMTRWHTHTLSFAEVRQFIIEHKDANYAICQYHDSSKEIWMGEHSHIDYIAPADESTVALLAEQGIAYRTLIQGRDFGYAAPKRWVSLLCISLLVAGAAFMLRWAWKKGALISATTGAGSGRVAG
jgi:hypothetical protein